MKGRHDKRGQCDNCPATKRLALVIVSGHKLTLCEDCRGALRRIQQETLTEAARAGKITPT